MSIFCRLVFVIFFAQKFEYSISFDINCLTFHEAYCAGFFPGKKR